MKRYIVLIMLTFALSGYAAYSQQTDSGADAKVTDPAYADLTKLKLLFSISSDTGGRIDVSGEKNFKITLRYPMNQFVNRHKSIPFFRPRNGFGGIWHRYGGVSHLFERQVSSSHGEKNNAFFYFIKHSPPVYVFSDRPYQIATQMTVPNFLKIWNKAGSFKEDPPNAHFTYRIETEPKPRQIDVVLSEPKYSQRLGTVTFTAKPLNPINWSLNAIKNTDFQWATLSIDNFCCGGGSTLGHAGKTLSGDAEHSFTQGANIITNTIRSVQQSAAFRAAENAAAASARAAKAAAEKAAHAAAITDVFKSVRTALETAGKEVAKKAAAVDAQVQGPLKNSFAGKEFDKAYDDIKKQIKDLYGSEKCFIIEAAFVITDATVAAIEAFATGGVDQADWESFAAAWAAGAASGLEAEVVAKAVGKVAETAGASEELAACIENATDIITAQAIEWGSMSAFLVDIFKQVVLEKQDCDNLFAACFATANG